MVKSTKVSSQSVGNTPKITKGATTQMSSKVVLAEADGQDAAEEVISHRTEARRMKKAKGAQAARVPPPELMDLVYNFLNDYNYVAAVNSIRSHHNKRPGHNYQEFVKTADKGGFPDLLTIFELWKSKSYVKQTPKQAKVTKAISETKPVDSDSDSSDSNKSSSSSDSEPEADSDEGSESSSDESMADDSSATLGRSDEVAPGEDESSSDSSSDDSDSEADENPASTPPKAKILAASSSSSSASSDSDSSSSSDSESEEDEGQDKEAAGVALPDSDSDDSSSDSDDDSSDDKDSSSSSDESSDEEEEKADTITRVAVNKAPVSENAVADRKRKLSTEDGASSPSTDNKRFKKEVKPFSRIPDNVEVDPRLASNAYVSYGYADEAHNKLIITKGKDFTKAKNKGKRGSYRGGMIDIQGARGIKFDD